MRSGCCPLQTIHWRPVRRTGGRLFPRIAQVRRSAPQHGVRIVRIIYTLAPAVLDHVRVADALHGVHFVLHARLLVGEPLVALPPLLQAQDHDEGHEHQEGHRRRQRRDHDHVLRGEPRVGRHPVGHVPRRVPRGRDLVVVAVLAERPVEAWAAAAGHAVLAHLLAGAAVEAGRRVAGVHLLRAVLAPEAGPAAALVVVDEHGAGASVGAGLGQAVVDAALAQRAHVAGDALAAEAVHQVDARASVEARVDEAVVDVGLAARAREAGQAIALVAVDAVDAGAAVEARVRGAVVHLVLAVDAAEAGRAAAGVAVGVVHAGAAVATGEVVAGVRRRLAVRAVPALGAFAAEASSGVAAVAAVQARLLGAVVALPLAVGAREARWTSTRVRALAGVEAGPVVAAGPVVGAVVEILVAEQAAPALVAQAVPWLLAGAVEAHRVALTLVAQRALPTAVTPASATNDTLLLPPLNIRFSPPLSSFNVLAFEGLAAVPVGLVASGSTNR